MRKISKLAVLDYVHEWRISICFVLALATVLGPILVLFGLKFGIVGNMINQLVEEPRNREIRPASSGRYSTDWFAVLQARPDVDFIVPRTRNIAANIQLKSEKSPYILNVELIPTAMNDPLLPHVKNPPTDYTSLIVSQSTAKKLALQPGDVLDGSISRHYQGRNQRIHLPLKVHSVAPVSAFSRNGAFGSLALLDALEDYRDGHAVPDLGWTGDKVTKTGYYTGFRLFARNLYDIDPLEHWFDEQGIDVHTRANEIDTVQRLDKNLSTLYWAIAPIGLIGFVFSFGASLWANIDRKRKELSILRLVGFNTLDIVWFPILQGLITALLGWLLAIVIYQLTSVMINNMMTSQLEPGQEVCYLLPIHYGIALLITCFSALIASLLAGLRSATIQPAEGLRQL